MKENKDKGKCNHKIGENVLFGDRELIELKFIKGHFEWEAKNGNPQPAKLKFCTRCGLILIKLD